MNGHKRGTCIHYGYARGLNGGPTCAAGVDIISRFGPREGVMARAPCIQEYPKHEQMLPCDKMCLPTPEEIAAHEAEIAASMDRMRVVMTAIKPWRDAKPRGKETVIDCPTGCGGKLHLSQSAYNGHVWGRCETSGCVSWME